MSLLLEFYMSLLIIGLLCIPLIYFFDKYYLWCKFFGHEWFRGSGHSDGEKYFIWYTTCDNCPAKKIDTVSRTEIDDAFSLHMKAAVNESLEGREVKK